MSNVILHNDLFYNYSLHFLFYLRDPITAMTCVWCLKSRTITDLVQSGGFLWTEGLAGSSWSKLRHTGPEQRAGTAGGVHSPAAYWKQTAHNRNTP